MRLCHVTLEISITISTCRKGNRKSLYDSICMNRKMSIGDGLRKTNYPVEREKTLTLRTSLQRASTAAGDQDFPTDFLTRNLEARVGSNPNNATMELSIADINGDL